MAMSFNLLALTRNYSNKAISSDRTNIKVLPKSAIVEKNEA
jgi:hypothetical protein